MTHSHALDFALTERDLARDDFAYLGLIGSLSKRAQFEQRLARARHARRRASSAMTCPIGVARRSAARSPARSPSPSPRELLQVRERARDRARADRGTARDARRNAQRDGR